jgi:hypothetical protein
MLNARIALQRMVSESFDVLVHPQPRIFRSYGARGSDGDALTYVALAAFITTLLDFVVFRSGSALTLAWSVIDKLFAFYIFAGVISFIGQQRGGLGNFTEIAYTFALFYVPIDILSWLIARLALLTPLGPVLLPWLWLIQIVAFVAQAYYAHIAIRGVMGLRQKEAWIAVGAGILTLLIIRLAFSRGAAAF